MQEIDYLGVFWPECLFPDVQSSLQERLRLTVFASCSVEIGKIIQRRGRMEVLKSGRLLPDHQFWWHRTRGSFTRRVEVLLDFMVFTSYLALY